MFVHCDVVSVAMLPSFHMKASFMGKAVRALSTCDARRRLGQHICYAIKSAPAFCLSSLGLPFSARCGGEVALWLVCGCLMPVLREVSCMPSPVEEQHVLKLLHVQLSSRACVA